MVAVKLVADERALPLVQRLSRGANLAERAAALPQNQARGEFRPLGNHLSETLTQGNLSVHPRSTGGLVR